MRPNVVSLRIKYINKGVQILLKKRNKLNSDKSIRSLCSPLRSSSCSPDQNNSIDSDRARGRSKTNEKVPNSRFDLLTSVPLRLLCQHTFRNIFVASRSKPFVCNFVAGDSCNALQIIPTKLARMSREKFR